MTLRWRNGAVAAALAALATVAGCGGGGSATAPPSADGPKVVFITNSNADWWNAVEKGMQDGGAEFGCQVTMRRNDGQTQGQVEKLREVLSMPDVQGVAVSVIEADAPGVVDAMRELQKAGKVVIAIDSDVAEEFADARAAYIGTNNVKAGQTAGKAAALLRPGGGKTAVFVGTASAANARERKGGFFEGAGEAFDEVETFEDGGNHQRARENVQSALSKYPELDVLVGLWSYNAPQIAEEMANAPKVRDRVTVVTFDLDEAARRHIAEGNIDATVCQNPYEMGRLGVKLLKGLIEEEDAMVHEVLLDGKTRDTGVRVVVPSVESPVKEGLEGEEVMTIDEMNSWLESKGLKST